MLFWYLTLVVMVETMTYDTELSEKTTLDEQLALSWLQSSVLERPIDPIQHALCLFGNYVEQQDLTKIDRRTPLGRFLRIARYGDHVWEASKKYDIPFDYFFALIMVESQWNTASINEADGGVGFIHFQPDVAKEYGMKVFTDNPKYSQYDFATLQKKGKSKVEIYKIHGRILTWLMGKSMSTLEQLDDRFHTIKCIQATARYLHKIKSKYVDKKMAKECTNSSWDIYKKDSEFDFAWMLTLNWFNKWPNRFAVNFAGGSHIKNIKTNLRAMRSYWSYVAEQMMKWRSYQDIFLGLQKIKL